MTLHKFVRDNGLSLAFWALFLLAIGGAVAAATLLAIEEPSAHPARGVAAALASPEFLKGVFGNWQAALLQLLLLIVLASFLRQRGAAHSREPADEAAREALTPRGKTPANDRSPVGRHFPWVYEHSMSLAFTLLFAASAIAFFLVDRAAANEERVRLGQLPLGLVAFGGSARFWFDLLETWQAEFFAMGAFLLLSIFLREKGSPESKPVGAGDRETGDVNE